MFKDETLAFIGSGVMAEAMIRGLVYQKLVDPKQIIASDPRKDRCQELRERYKIVTTTDNTEAAEKGDIVTLAVKPQVLPKVMPDIRGHLRRRNLLLSILAGAPIKMIADGLAHAAVIRAMPKHASANRQGDHGLGCDTGGDGAPEETGAGDSRGIG